MNELLKLLSKLLADGYASINDKEQVKELYSKLSDEEQSEVKDQVDAVTELPDDASEESDDSEITEEDVEKTVSQLVEKSVSKIENDYKEKFENWKKEQKELAEKRLGVFGNSEKKTDRSELNKKVKQFVSAILQGDHLTAKDLSEGVDASGGYIVDTELDAEIRHLVTQYGVARREMEVITMSTPSIDLTTLTTDIDAYWTDEGAPKTSDDISIGRVVLSLNKLAVIVPMTDELLEDSEIDLVGFLTKRIAEKIAKKEDEAFFNGDGTSASGGFVGLLNNTSVNVVTITGTGFNSLDADDLLDMQDATPQGALDNGKYYMHRSIRSIVRKLKSSDGTYIYQAPTENSPATIWGKPVVEVEAMPTSNDSSADTPFVIFGDLKKASVVGVKGGMRVKLSTEATIRNTADDGDINLFRQDMTGLRVVERVGFAVVIPSAVTVLKTSATSA